MKLSIEDKDYQRAVKLAARFGMTTDELLGRTVADMLADMEAQIDAMEKRAGRAKALPRADKEKLMQKILGVKPETLPQINPKKRDAMVKKQKQNPAGHRGLKVN